MSRKGRVFIVRACCLFSSCQIFLLALLLLFLTGQVVDGETLDNDKEGLLELKSYLQKINRVYDGDYARWGDSDPTPCNWSGITCETGRVTRVCLSSSYISGHLFANFSKLTALTHLDLSRNTIGGRIPPELNQCRSLKYLNLSHNIIEGELHLPALTSLEVLDLTLNRLVGGIGSNFPGMCSSLVTLNISMNNFTGDLTDTFNSCWKLKYLDLSTNYFTGSIWDAASGLVELSVAENSLVGTIAADAFRRNCSLRIFDVAQNKLYGEFPSSVASCRNLTNLNLWGNKFRGRVPSSIGSLQSLAELLLGSNTFDRDIPEALLNCSNLAFLDLSRNDFRGEVQRIFGRFKQLKFLVLHNNRYTGGIESSGILDLPNIMRLDLSYNHFSGPLPAGLVGMPRLLYLVSTIGRDPSLPLELSRRNGRYSADSGECIVMKSWLPDRYPPFSFIYQSLTRKSCRNQWERILRGYGVFPICTKKSGYRTTTMSGYIHLTGNLLSGEIPPQIGELRNFSLVNLNRNNFSGRLPPEISRLPLTVLNVSENGLSGEIPQELGNITCLQNLDLSLNNFSGELPMSLNQLSELNKFNVSFNALLSGCGVIPITGQLSTFGDESFMGDGLIVWAYKNGTVPVPPGEEPRGGERSPTVMAFSAFIGFCSAFLSTVVFNFVLCAGIRRCCTRGAR